MAYNVNKTNGSILATVADGTIDTSTDLVLIGKNYAGYGEFLNENFVKLLENFSNTSAPASPLSGQLWWDSSNSLLKVYTGTQFKVISSTTSSSSAPSGAITGDLWFDTVNGQLKVYNGSSFITVGPAFTSGTGTSGAIVETVVDAGATSHVVVKMYVENTVVATFSKDAEFTPQTPLTGFTTIKPGLQLSSTVSNVKFHGTATDADTLDGIDSTGFLRKNQTETTNAGFSILNDANGLTVGADSDFNLSISGSNITLANDTSDGDFLFTVNDGGVTKTALTIDGSANGYLLYTGGGAIGSAPSNALATKDYVDSTVSGSGALPTSGGTMTGDILVSGTVNFGSSGSRISTVFATTFNGTATSAQYADVAEKFTADTQYEPGTVVALGGVEEITAAAEELSDTVFGVVSSRPAYLMNAGLENGVPVAVAGRVPVRVVGKVNKGDRLVSAGNGLARAASSEDVISAFNVIGRALETKTTDGEGVVESFVTIN